MLLVDGNPHELVILRCLIQNMALSYAVVAVASATAALRQLTLYNVALVITDYTLPGMNGLLLAHMVRGASPHTRVILMTDFATPGLERGAQSPSIDHYLPKPFRLERLEQIVRESVA
jgi:CheY-like chemotaxis protein